jgi:predicted transcriptional regulator
MTKLELTHTDERVLEQLHRRKGPQALDAIAGALGLTREVVVLSLARLQLNDLAEPIPGPDASGQRTWKAKG